MMTETTKDTSSQIKAIETEYKGYRFRSRLEARWAVFFETAGIEWKYEPEGFVCDTYENEPPIRYLPDFYLPKTETWVEVKGTDCALKKDSAKLESILDWNSPIPGICDSYSYSKFPPVSRGLLILGDIPEPKWGFTLHPIIQHHKGLIWSWCTFESYGLKVFDRYKTDNLLDYFTNGPEEWSVSSFHIDSPLGIKNIYESYKAARSARFEHGEYP